MINLKKKNKTHILKNNKLRKIRYNCRSILFLEFRKRIKEFFEEKGRLSALFEKKEISYNDHLQKKRNLHEKESKLRDALNTNPIYCIKCKSRQNDLERIEEGFWICVDNQHEQNEEGLSDPRSPFDENFKIWDFFE